MSITYRGQTAQPSSTVNAVATDVKGKFRGRPFALRKAQKLVQRKTAMLQYRGSIY